MWYTTYRDTCLTEKVANPDGTPFHVTAFEGEKNQTVGSFNYTSLIARLDLIAEFLLTCDTTWRKSLADHVAVVEINGSLLPAVYGNVAHAFEVLYNPQNLNDRPVVRLIHPKKMFHPAVSEDGCVYWFMGENAFNQMRETHSKMSRQW